MTTTTRYRTGSAAAVFGRLPPGGWPADLPALLATPEGRDELGKRLYPLAANLARRHRRTSLDEEEVLGETLLWLLKAVGDWRPDGGGSVLNYMIDTARWAWSQADRQGRAVGPKHGPRRFRRRSLAGEDADTGRAFGVLLADPTPEPLVHPADEAQWAEDAGRWPWRVLALSTVGGLTTQEAADELGLSRRRADALIALAVRRIRTARLARRIAAGRANRTGGSAA